jgi:hypothetical protein
VVRHHGLGNTMETNDVGEESLSDNLRGVRV